jgi:hypothetical protein
MATTETHQEPTTENFTAAITAVVGTFGGDYVYVENNDSGCWYFTPDGEPLCLIGRSLALMGYGPGDTEEGFRAVTVMRDLGFPEDCAFAATSAQIVQDNGGSWGDAVEKYLLALTAFPDINYEL